MALTSDVFDDDHSVEWKFHLEYVHDGESIKMPAGGVIIDAQHDPETGRLAVWYKEFVADGPDPDAGVRSGLGGDIDE